MNTSEDTYFCSICKEHVKNAYDYHEKCEVENESNEKQKVVIK